MSLWLRRQTFDDGIRVVTSAVLPGHISERTGAARIIETPG
jgi:hypothetical protein